MTLNPARTYEVKRLLGDRSEQTWEIRARSRLDAWGDWETLTGVLVSQCPEGTLAMRRLEDDGTPATRFMVPISHEVHR